jgi:dUTP pyrophosphatase
MGGIALNLIDYAENKPKRGFELISEKNKKTSNEKIILPKRATKNSAAYDFYSNDECAVLPNRVVKFWTDVKAYMQPDEFLMLDVRSSMGGKFMLANTIGIVDSDYYDNEDNEGNIGIFLKNISDEPQIIHVGDKIGQGLFVKYLTTDDDKTTKIRKGGFGSTNES